jgi:hypothetical protein
MSKGGIVMRELGLKLCLFLFLAAVLAGRSSELGTLTGAITGTILLWPIYRRLLPAPPPRTRRRVPAEEEESEEGAE